MKPLLASLTLIGVGMHFAANAADLPASQSISAQRVAIGVCAACHGAHGVSNIPRFPVLAGQAAGYVSAQLKAFKEHTRSDADAQNFMWGIAATLRDDQIEAVSQYYAAQPPHPAIPQSGGAALGQEIFEHGIESRQVPPCAACHGPHAEGIADIPRLAGQHPSYFVAQMLSFRNSERSSETMRAIAGTLSTSELEALASFLRSR